VLEFTKNMNIFTNQNINLTTIKFNDVCLKIIYTNILHFSNHANCRARSFAYNVQIQKS